MSNLQDLNTHLFDQIERLGNTDLKGDDLKSEINRSQAITSVAKSIVENASLQLKATQLRVEYAGLNRDVTLQNLIGASK